MSKSTKNKQNFMKIFVVTLLLVLVAGFGLLGALLVKNDEKIQLKSQTEKADVQKSDKTDVQGIGWETVDEAELAKRKEEREAKKAEEARLAEELQKQKEDPYDEKGNLKNENNRIIQKKITPKKGGEITLLFAGDILLDDEYAVMATMKKRENGVFDSYSEETMREMQSADIFMVNNEFTYTNRGTPTEGKTFTFRADPECAAILLDMGVDIVSLANNHAYDFGEISMLDTFDTLNNIEMPYVGAGLNLDDAAQTIYFEVEDTKIGIVSATQIERVSNPDTKPATETSPGVFRCFSETRIYDEIAKAKENCDFVVAYVHWGTESTDELDWSQPDISVKLAEAGADLIVGAHPHVLQEIANVKGVPTIFSLGNYLFNSSTCDTGLLKVTLQDKELKSFQFIPAKQSGCCTQILSNAEKERVLTYMRSISDTVAIDDNGYVTF